MCGIVGFVYKNQNSLCNIEVISRMTESLVHRGPDSQGIFIDQSSRIALGHRRLAIVDLTSAGAQPMVSVSSRYTMVFNGEIYNHKLIRKKINKEESYWRGTSDTETLLAGFDKFGVLETVSMTCGMFAIAVYDRDEDAIWLVRDRMGEKPLYYGFIGTGSNISFCFASEVSAIKRHPSFLNDINKFAIAHYLRFGSIGGDQSIYSGIRKVLPAEILRYDLQNSSIERTRYWSASSGVTQKCGYNDLGDEEYIDQLYSLLNQSIKNQMIADVPVGAFLSGGVDSSTIVALMQRLSSQRVNTYSIGFSDSDFNEADSARKLSEELATCHHELIVSHNDVINSIECLSAINDEPFADPSQIPTFLVAKLARESVTVALSGDGGDEIFGGYARHLSVLTYWRYLNLVPAYSRSWIKDFAKSFYGSLKTKQYASNLIGGDCNDRIYKVEKAFDVFGAKNLSEYYDGLCAHWPHDSFISREFLNEGSASFVEQRLVKGLSDFDQILNFDLTTYLPDNILYKVDRASMAVSLETRIPFLDHLIVEFAANLPNRFKIRKHNGKYISKWLLKKMATKYCGINLMNRPKQGFEMPIRSWLCGPLKDWADDLLRCENIYEYGIIDKAMVLDRWAEHLSGRRNLQKPIWNILMIQQWLRNI